MFIILGQIKDILSFNYLHVDFLQCSRNGDVLSNIQVTLFCAMNLKLSNFKSGMSGLSVNNTELFFTCSYMASEDLKYGTINIFYVYLLLFIHLPHLFICMVSFCCLSSLAFIRNKEIKQQNDTFQECTCANSSTS